MKIQKSVLKVILAALTVCLLSSCMEITIRSENWKSLDMYGKVIDQYGMPVAAAKVQGSIGLNISMVESGGKFVYTQTDSQGCFHFLHIQGAGIGIWPQKDGYYYNLKIPWQRPADYHPDPKNPIIFRVWKLRGSELLAQSAIDASLATDGGTGSFDIASGKAAPNGDFKITFRRIPPENKPGLVHAFDWQFKIEISNGGMIQENDPYPFWAPKNDYQPSFELTMNSNNPSWQSQFIQNFYIKDFSGKYGVMKFEIYSASNSPRFRASFMINPSGSQNLEPSSLP